ncbi:MAG: YncE family protein [Acidimicrobiales bacterium]
MPPPDLHRYRTRRLAPVVVAAVGGLVAVAACGGGEPADVRADAPTTAAPTTAAPTTTTAAPTTTSLPTTLAPITEPPTTVPLPPPTTAKPLVNVYGEIRAGNRNPNTAGARFLVYVPHEVSGTTMVIDPTTDRIIDTFPTGAESQHVVPSWDMSTLYAIASRGDQVTPIDPRTGKAGKPLKVEDPYNLYFTPDGAEAIVVEEGNQRFTFRDAKTFEPHSSVQTQCPGLNHLDYSADLSFFVATCEFEGSLIKFDMASRTVVDKIWVDMAPSGKRPRSGHSMPQDVRLSADGSVFFIADLQSDGIYVIDAATFRQIGFIPTGVGAHGLYPSRDGTKLYVVNRGTNLVGGPPHGQGSVAVVDMATRQVVATWPIPGGGSPDMGNLTEDGTQLWLGGRYDGEVYVFDTVAGRFDRRIKVGVNPHGLTVWPQPGRFSLGHTGNIR